MFRIFELFTEIAGWLLIVASPTLIGLATGGLIYMAIPTTFGLFIGISVTALGLVLGVVWATRIYGKHGTIRFLSRLSGTPELDEKKEDEKK